LGNTLGILWGGYSEVLWIKILLEGYSGDTLGILWGGYSEVLWIKILLEGYSGDTLGILWEYSEVLWGYSEVLWISPANPHHTLSHPTPNHRLPTSVLRKGICRGSNETRNE
jgi:cobalamin synthase